jgi:hypothetical protein
MAAKAGLLLARCQLRVSEDWVVETVDIELAAHHAVIELVSKPESGTGIFNADISDVIWGTSVHHGNLQGGPARLGDKP